MKRGRKRGERGGEDVAEQHLYHESGVSTASASAASRLKIEVFRNMGAKSRIGVMRDISSVHMPHEIAIMVREHGVLQSLVDIVKSHVRKPPLKLGISVLSDISRILASYCEIKEYFDATAERFGESLTKDILKLIANGTEQIYAGHVRERWEEATNSWIRFLKTVLRHGEHDRSLLFAICTTVHAGAVALQNESVAPSTRFRGMGSTRDILRDYAVRLEAYEIFVIVSQQADGALAIVDSCFRDLLRSFRDSVRSEGKYSALLSKTVSAVLSFPECLSALLADIAFVISALFEAFGPLRRLVDVWIGESDGQVTEDFRDAFEAFNNAVTAVMSLFQFAQTSSNDAFDKLLSWHQAEVSSKNGSTGIDSFWNDVVRLETSVPPVLDPVEFAVVQTPGLKSRARSKQIKLLRVLTEFMMFKKRRKRYRPLAFRTPRLPMLHIIKSLLYDLTAGPSDGNEEEIVLGSHTEDDFMACIRSVNCLVQLTLDESTDSDSSSHLVDAQDIVSVSLILVDPNGTAPNWSEKLYTAALRTAENACLLPKASRVRTELFVPQLSEWVIKENSKSPRAERHPLLSAIVQQLRELVSGRKGGECAGVMLTCGLAQVIADITNQLNAEILQETAPSQSLLGLRYMLHQLLYDIWHLHGNVKQVKFWLAPSSGDAPICRQMFDESLAAYHLLKVFANHDHGNHGSEGFDEAAHTVDGILDIIKTSLYQSMHTALLVPKWAPTLLEIPDKGDAAAFLIDILTCRHAFSFLQSKERLGRSAAALACGCYWASACLLWKLSSESQPARERILTVFQHGLAVYENGKLMYVAKRIDAIHDVLHRDSEEESMLGVFVGMMCDAIALATRAEEDSGLQLVSAIRHLSAILCDVLKNGRSQQLPTSLLRRLAVRYLTLIDIVEGRKLVHCSQTLLLRVFKIGKVVQGISNKDEVVTTFIKCGNDAAKCISETLAAEIAALIAANLYALFSCDAWVQTTLASKQLLYHLMRMCSAIGDAFEFASFEEPEIGNRCKYQFLISSASMIWKLADGTSSKRIIFSSAMRPFIRSLPDMTQWEGNEEASAPRMFCMLTRELLILIPRVCIIELQQHRRALYKRGRPSGLISYQALEEAHNQKVRRIDGIGGPTKFEERQLTQHRPDTPEKFQLGDPLKKALQYRREERKRRLMMMKEEQIV